jgi:hypothetical protein
MLSSLVVNYEENIEFTPQIDSSIINAVKREIAATMPGNKKVTMVTGALTYSKESSYLDGMSF